MSDEGEVSRAQALMALQVERRRLGDLARTFAQQRPDAFGGFWFSDDESAKVVVGVVGNPAEFRAPAGAGITFVRVPRTDAELRAAQDAVDLALTDLHDVIDFYDQRVDPVQGTVVVEAASTDTLRVARALEPWSGVVRFVDLGTNEPEKRSRSFEFWTVADDHVSLTLHWAPAEGVPAVTLAETARAVHVTVFEVIRPYGAGPASWSPATVTATLDGPLGDRLVVDATTGETKPRATSDTPYAPQRINDAHASAIRRHERRRRRKPD